MWYEDTDLTNFTTSNVWFRDIDLTRYLGSYEYRKKMVSTIISPSPSTFALLSPWANYNSTNNENFEVWKDGKLVHINGFLQIPSTPLSVMCTLPLGYRPTKQIRRRVDYNTGVNFVSIDTDGTVKLISDIASDRNWLNLGDITFKVQ
jgi:hypothetical protein